MLKDTNDDQDDEKKKVVSNRNKFIIPGNNGKLNPFSKQINRSSYSLKNNFDFSEELILQNRFRNELCRRDNITVKMNKNKGDLDWSLT